MEHIYFATSPQFQGIVKIGRTDRDPCERMGELAGYGFEGFEGESTWSVAKEHVIIVDDNSSAEAMLHGYFSESRVSDNRELFFTDDIKAMVSIAQERTGGKLLSEIKDETLAETIIEEFAEWGVAIAGAAVGGVPGIVLAHKGLERLRKTDAYKSAKQRSEKAATKGLGVLADKMEQHSELTDQFREKATQASSWVKNALPTKLSFRGKAGRAGPPHVTPGKQSQGKEKPQKQFLLGTFTSLEKARSFAKNDSKLKIQRLEGPDNALWAVYAPIGRTS